METILYNIFKTTSAMTKPETILESSYKVLQSSQKRTTLKRPVQFSKAIQFYATFKAYCYNISLTLTKAANLYFS